MHLKEQIAQELKAAMKNKDTKKRDALRLLNSAIKQVEVDERKELTDADIVKIIQKQVKQRKDSLAQYKEAGREDLAAQEELEIAYYEAYLPKQLDDDELRQAVEEIIEEVGAASMKDLGKVMGAATKKLSGVADGKRISETAKRILSTL